jgi:hypothetical protein
MHDETFALECIKAYLDEKGFDTTINQGELKIYRLCIRLTPQLDVRIVEGIKEASITLLLSDHYGEEISRKSAHIDLHNPRSFEQLVDILEGWRAKIS